MFTLGINAAFHDPAACLVRDGRVLAAAEEERFTRIKHGKRPVPFSTWELPFHAIEFCLRQAGIGLREVDHVAYSFQPSTLLGPRIKAPFVEIPLDMNRLPESRNGDSPWDPLFLSSIVNAPRQLIDGAPHHLRHAFKGAELSSWRWHFVEHHLAHAASAFHPSPFDRAAVLCLDGRGELATTSYWRGEGTALDELGHVDLPNSIGLLYEEMTRWLGFLHSSDEYKVMALASFGAPRYADTFRRIIINGDGGQYRVDGRAMEEWFGDARERGGPIEQRHLDIARSLQCVVEEQTLGLAQWLREATGERHLCMAGGVALNCVLNARLRDHAGFDDVWVQPAAGDAGTALGAALWVDADARRLPARNYVMDHAYLGPAFGDHEIGQFLARSKLPFRKLEDVAGETAGLLAADRIVGWFQGGMEFGPRALGARSILASPLHEEMRDRLNEIKDREDFRPVAPVVLEEEADAWFANARRSPYMLFVFDVRPERASQIPAVTHVDGTARIQTIRRDQHERYYDVLAAFRDRTGVPVLVNTSFNTRGEPIVCTPRDAVECFWTSPLDALVIGSFLLEKRPP